jgi:hypothetical protein
MDKDRIIYSIAVEDIFTVAKEVLRRRPTLEEVKFVEDKIGDYINWYDTIDDLLSEAASEKINTKSES